MVSATPRLKNSLATGSPNRTIGPGSLMRGASAPPPKRLTHRVRSVIATMEGSDQFSADIGSVPSYGPPDAGPVVRVRDVLLCPMTPIPDAPDDVWDRHPPAASPRWSAGRERALRSISDVAYGSHGSRPTRLSS